MTFNKKDTCLSSYIIGQRLKILRTKCEFTTKQLSDFLGINCKSYQELESGKKKLNTVQLERICRLYCIDENKLIFDKTYIPTPQGVLS